MSTGPIPVTTNILPPPPVRTEGIGNTFTTRTHRPAAPGAKPGRPRDIFSRMPQRTFQEVKVTSIAVADGATGIRWREVPGDLALAHVIPGEPLTTRLTIGPELDWWTSPATHEAIRKEIECFTAETVLLWNLVVGLAIEHGHVTVELDDLIRGLGWQIRTRDDRSHAWRTVWRWLCLLERISVHGVRVGTWTDKLTREKHDIAVNGELIHLSERYYSEQQLAFDGSAPPVAVTISALAWLNRFRGNGQVLQSFGTIKKLAGLPTRQPRGAWALSVGLALNQLWRERAAQTPVVPVGEQGRQTARFRHFTRRELLGMFHTEPNFEEVLASAKPARARQHWQDAIKLLKERGVIRYYAELQTMPDSRRGWADFWLDGQQLDIRPSEDETEAVAEISKAGAAARKRLKKGGKK